VEFRPVATVSTTTYTGDVWAIRAFSHELGYKSMTNAESPVQMSGSALHRHEG
jgi:hypothetical protein